MPRPTNPPGPVPPLPQLLPPIPNPVPVPPHPPWPEVLQPQPFLPQRPPLHLHSVRCGCYLINYTPTGGGLVTYDGTLRVECHSNGRTASGDLYQRPTIKQPMPLPAFPPPIRPILEVRPQLLLLPGPNPAAGIPILARARYRYYLSVTQILEQWTLGNAFTLGWDRWRFSQATQTWTDEGAFTALMTWVPAPASYPSSGDYLTGDVKNAAGVTVGRLTMGWVSSYLRKATVEIDRVPQSESPLNNGGAVTWRTVGDGIGWDITVDESDANVAEPSGESWSNAECHAAMLARRDTANLDADWRYHVLCVRRLDATERGIMYDNGATDSNNVPREGCAISSHWMIPNTPDWGLVQGLRFGTASAPYFRTAVHETGHAMCLYHNTADNGFLNTTDVISASATPANQFPNNIQWSYAADDQKRLRHMPDMYVRPGGVPFGTSYASTPISPDDMVSDAEGLGLEVVPLLDAVPLGAPVRVTLRLTGRGEAPCEAPSSLGLDSGFVRGDVTDPSGVVRTFSPLVLCVDHVPLRLLRKGESVTASLTLLRGGQGSLFSAPGPYTITVEARWDGGGAEVAVTGTATVMVTSVVDDVHAEAALKVLSTPDTLLALVLGGDHMKDGIAAVQAAMKSPVLRPHFAHIEARRLATRFGKRKANPDAAAGLIDDTTVMSPAEVKKAASFASAGGSSAAAKGLAKRLKARIAKTPVGDEVKSIVDAL